MSSYQKRRKPYLSVQKHKKRREFVLKPGLKGFLCTCNYREKDCIRESFNILNEYADTLYGDGKTAATASATVSAVPVDTTEKSSALDAKTHSLDSDEEEEEDIENALNKELEMLKAERTKPNMSRFQLLESGANNCIFIQTTIPEPVEFVHHIMKDLEATRKQKTRFLIRLLPIEITCKAYIEDIRKAADALFDKYFTKEGKTFAVLFNRRNSSGVDREDLIRDLAEMVMRRHPDNRADLKHPQLAILVEVIRNMCCLSVIPEYFTLRKYNLLELSTPEGGIKISDSKDDSGQKVEGDKKRKADISEEVTEEEAAVDSLQDFSSEHHNNKNVDKKDNTEIDKEVNKSDVDELLKD